MSFRKVILSATVISAVVMGSLTACGSGDGETAGGASPADSDEEAVLILKEAGVFSVDDVEAAGWKNSKELSPETLPDAISAWYGFYNQRDVEVRIYESHELAISSGQPPADIATGRGKPAPFAVGGISATRTSYTTYAIVGNLILLCEVKIEDCQGLLNAIE
jgi:hypothetical protein